ncbi:MULTISPECIES: phage virion morphogenesis protein [unclassified Paracoccus (in: a-proteobacteria)]|uniref:phage virion morphogenesis protein n=1 Tax=unclassified Paracoccus (in: a-proteobacteria) TaxID=2688777 RepID=UPI0012B2667F|nr:MULTISPECIES: phage virion morphogenesis protein [unclassified Paracoccus (in: a-proteobacteria)]UXU74358.1 phage virion morphogenesis protein [Paracoccus sp. SMMA_5]UXU80248.1 phage virion morphogenesis protein [Paracoccus sp. SMMA_5_TC]
MVGVVVNSDVSLPVQALSRLDEEALALIVHEIGALIEDQTRLRLAEQKTTPDGRAWPAWSRAYARTRKPRHSLLIGEGNPGLLESVQNYTTGLSAVVGTNLVYGAVHQFGSEHGAVPERAWLGLSADNRADIEALLAGRIEELLA